jgi:hypothetical protein
MGRELDEAKCDEYERNPKMITSPFAGGGYARDLNSCSNVFG